MMEKVRFGIIGVGAIGPSHIYAVNNVDSAELAAVCDLNLEQAEEYGEKYGVPSFEKVEDMLEADLTDAVSICTPSGYHLEPALKAVDAGQHLLVEKPLEITTDRIDMIIDAARKNDVKLGNVFQKRFSPRISRLRELIREGMLGKLFSGSAYTKRFRTQEYFDSGDWRGTWEVDGGGCLMNQGIHILDLLIWFLGSAEKVTAIIDNPGRDVEVETLALGLVEFKNGARGVIEGTTLAYPELPQYIEIFGSRGTVALTGDEILRWDLVDPTDEEAAVREKLLKEQDEEKGSIEEIDAAPGTAVPTVDMGHTPIVEDFVNAILEDREPFVTGEKARESVQLITGIYESGRNDKKLVELD